MWKILVKKRKNELLLNKIDFNDNDVLKELNVT